jgi:hypothetical protein
VNILAAADGDAAAADAAAEAAADGAAADAAGTGVELLEHAPTTTAITASAAIPRVRLFRFMNGTPPSSDQGLSSGAGGRAVSLHRSRVIAGSLTSSFVDRTGEPPRMLSVGFIEQSPRPFGQSGARALLGQGCRPTVHEEPGGPDAVGLHDGDWADGGPGSNRTVRAADGHHSVHVRSPPEAGVPRPPVPRHPRVRWYGGQLVRPIQTGHVTRRSPRRLTCHRASSRPCARGNPR